MECEKVVTAHAKLLWPGMMDFRVCCRQSGTNPVSPSREGQRGIYNPLTQQENKIEVFTSAGTLPY